MPKSTGKTHSLATQNGGSHQPRTRMWTVRNSSTGLFMRAKKAGGPFRGVKREN